MSEKREMTVELANKLTEMSGRINKLEVIFEHNRALNNRIVYALQTGDATYALALAKEEVEV